MNRALLEDYIFTGQSDPKAFVLGVRIGEFAVNAPGSRPAEALMEAQLSAGEPMRAGFMLGHRIAETGVEI